MSDGLYEALSGTYFTNKRKMKKILYFSASWCGPCKMLGPIMEELKNEGLPIQKIDVDSNPEISQQYGIRNVPTVILTQNGVEVTRKIGASPKQIYLDMYNQN